MSHLIRRWTTRAVACAVIAGGSGVVGAGAAPAASGGSAGVTAGTATSAGRSAAACHTPWGTGEKGRAPVTMGRAPISDVRAGRHACFDRLVIDIRGAVPRGAVNVEYVPVVYQDGTGDPVPLRGRAKLNVSLGHVVYDSRGRIVYAPKKSSELVRTGGFTSLRQVALAGSFEGVSTIGIGVTRRVPFRVVVLPGTRTSRVVIDVAHRP